MEDPWAIGDWRGVHFAFPPTHVWRGAVSINGNMEIGGVQYCTLFLVQMRSFLYDYRDEKEMSQNIYKRRINKRDFDFY